MGDGLLLAGSVRLVVLNHVTRSINSICDVIGPRPFTARERSTDLWPLARRTERRQGTAPA
ncbi:MAG: hypothetical protein JNM77_09840 [Pseudonocardia sp.]|nr:hypothetical protein [Pseudonocardia sp.]